MPNQPQPQGGTFSKYQGEQVQAVPNGYLESAQAQAAMYANIGKSISDAITESKTMELKKDELAIAGETATQAARKNDIAQAKLDADAASKEDDKTTKYITARTTAFKELYGMHDQSIGTIDARISGLQLQLDEDADSKGSKFGKLSTSEKNAIVGQMGALRKKRETHQAAIDEITTGMKLPPTLTEYKDTEKQEAAKIARRNMVAEASQVIRERGPEMVSAMKKPFEPIINSAPVNLFADYLKNAFGVK
jgi:hypothetical protein